MRREILDGQIFGEWQVIEYAGNKKQLCRCSCGVIKEVDTQSLKKHKSTNCGDKYKHIVEGAKKFKDLTGQKFGSLTALRYLGDTKWECVCDCTNVEVRSWKHLNADSRCKLCAHREQVQKWELDRAEKERIKAEQSKSKAPRVQMIGLQVNDLTVISKIDSDRYLCKCICGAEVEVRGHSLRHPKTTGSYICKHEKVVGRRFGKLVVIQRKPYQQCVCKCDCGNTKETWIGNLLGGTVKSCGCLVGREYSKEQVIEMIKQYTESTGQKPFAYDLSDMLGVKMTAVYGYIKEYDLKHYLNTRFGSKAEQEIYNKLSNRFDVKLHDRTILEGDELDIYIPSKKLAIEFNGNYWHSSINKDKTYHQHKTMRCISKGIRLIHIFEYEWNNPGIRDKIDKYLDNVLGESSKLYGRDCTVMEISSEDAKKFAEENHLQGWAPSKISIGLINSGSLVGIMTFGVPRFNHEYEYELIRLCYRSDISIIGGAEKMFKYFVDKYMPKSIITYCSLAKFTGNVYIKLGFELDRHTSVTEPNYVWVDAHSKNVFTRYQTMKYKLIEMGLGTEDMTEDEIMASHSYYKVYDSGNLKLVYGGD